MWTSICFKVFDTISEIIDWKAVLDNLINLFPIYVNRKTLPCYKTNGSEMNLYDSSLGTIMFFLWKWLVLNKWKSGRSGDNWITSTDKRGEDNLGQRDVDYWILYGSLGSNELCVLMHCFVNKTSNDLRIWHLVYLKSRLWKRRRYWEAEKAVD